MVLKRMPEPTIPESSPWVGDYLNRRPEGELLTRLIRSLSSSFVIAINGKWGSGKSVFLSRLEKHLEQNSVPVLSINAWRTDYLADPLLAFVSAARVRLEREASRSEATKGAASKLIEKIAEHGAVLVQPAAAVLSTIFAPGAAETAATLGSAASIAGQHLLNWEKTRRDANETFRELLGDVRDKLTHREPTRPVKPMVVIIDELDRCRPDYAVSVLERIKHYFDVPGIVFVIATDGENLPRAISSVYGDKINGELYLRKFFDMEFHLSDPRPSDFINILQDQFDITPLTQWSPLEEKHLKDCYAYPEEYPKLVSERNRGLDAYELSAAFAVFAEKLGLSLRDQVQAFSVVNAYFRSIHPRSVIFPSAIVFAVCLRFSHLDQFETLRSRKTSLASLVDKHPWLPHEAHGMDALVFAQMTSTENGQAYALNAMQSTSNLPLSLAGRRAFSRLKTVENGSIKDYLYDALRLTDAFAPDETTKEDSEKG